MTLNCIWWSGSSSESLENVEHRFITTTSRSTLTGRGSTSLSPGHESKKYVKKLFAFNKIMQKAKQNKTKQKVDSQISWHKIIQDGLTCR